MQEVDFFELNRELGTPHLRRLSYFRPFTARQRRLLWKDEPNPDLRSGDIIRATLTGQALWVKKLDERGVVVKRVGAVRAASDPRGECYTVGNAGG